MRSLERALGACRRTRERAFLVAEQGTLHQPFRQGSAVERYERLTVTGALIVNGAREQLLAGAGFSQEQHGGACWCDHRNRPHDRLQHGAVTDDLSRRPELCYLFPECLILATEFRHLQRLIYGDVEGLAANRLGQVINCAAPNRNDGMLDARVRRHHDHRNVVAQFAAAGQEIQARRLGHPVICENQVHRRPAHRSDGFVSAFGQERAMPELRQGMLEDDANCRLIVNTENRRHQLLPGEASTLVRFWPLTALCPAAGTHI